MSRTSSSEYKKAAAAAAAVDNDGNDNVCGRKLVQSLGERM